MFTTAYYSLDRIDEAAAELMAKAQGFVVTCAGWDIVDGDKRFCPSDIVGLVDLDKVVAHAKREIASMTHPCRMTNETLSYGAKICFRANGAAVEAKPTLIEAATGGHQETAATHRPARRPRYLPTMLKRRS